MRIRAGGARAGDRGHGHGHGHGHGLRSTAHGTRHTAHGARNAEHGSRTATCDLDHDLDPDPDHDHDHDHDKDHDLACDHDHELDRDQDRRAGAWTFAALLLLLLLPHPAAADDAPPLPHPVICLHGFRGDASTFDGALAPLRAAGLEPIALSWRPASGEQGIAEAAEQVVAPMIEHALRSRGYPDGARISLLGHSLGGLVARQLVERGGWAERTERVVLVAVPNHGARTGLGRAACGLPRGDPWRAAGCDTRAGSPLLGALGAAPQPVIGARYLAIGSVWRGTPMPGGGDLDGDGRTHANDGVVGTESPALVGVPLRIWKGRGPGRHTELFCNATIVGWLTGFLADGAVPAPLTEPRAARADDLCALAEVGVDGPRPSAAPAATTTGPAGEPTGLLTVRVDASGAVDPLVTLKIHSSLLTIQVDGETRVERRERRVPRDELLLVTRLPAGPHAVDVAWEVRYRIAADRHHPMGTAPDEQGFRVPDEGLARCQVEIEPDGDRALTVRLYRKASVGLQGRTWIECGPPAALADERPNLESAESDESTEE